MPFKNSYKRRHSSEDSNFHKLDNNSKRQRVTDEEAAENLLNLAMAEPQRKPNFSALNSSNGMNKHTQPGTNKPGTAKKLVIKNFKGK